MKWIFRQFEPLIISGFYYAESEPALLCRPKIYNIKKESLFSGFFFNRLRELNSQLAFKV